MAHAQKNDALLQARQAAQLTQIGLAGRSGVSQSVISSMEGGHVPGALVSAITIARALGTTVEVLFGALVVTQTNADAPQPPTSPTSRTKKPTRSRSAKAPGPARAAPPRSKRAPKARAA